MYLLIDSSVKDQITLVLFDTHTSAKNTYDASNRAVLACVDALLTEKHLKPQDVQGIAVVVGAGGFSSTRVAVTVANTFAYAFQIPLLAVTSPEAAHPEQLVERLLEQEPGKYMAPEYSGEPNITTKK